jgi:uncharacterized membrane protein
VVGAFKGPDAAERALNGLKAAGFTPEQVSVVAKDRADTQQLAERTEMAGEGAATGAVTGGLLGGLAGFLVGISALVIPGIGPIVGGGILLSTLAGAGLGAATGGLVGALAAHGVPEEDARGYEAHVGQGRILLTAHATDEVQAQAAHRAFNDAGGADVRGYGAAA